MFSICWQAAAAAGAVFGGEPAAGAHSLVTDRPDFTESPQAVPLGRVQVEGGVTVSREQGGTSVVTPELLVRTGIADRVELRLSPPSAVHAGNDWSLADAGVGFKVEVLRGSESAWLFSLIGQTSLPTGEDDASAGEAEPEIKLLWSTDLCEGVSLSGNINGAWRWAEEGRFFEPAVSVSLGADVTDSVGVYAEYYAFLGTDDAATEAHSLNGGVTYQLSPTFQLDARVGVGLNGDADDMFAGVGFGVLF